MIFHYRSSRCRKINNFFGPMKIEIGEVNPFSEIAKTL